MKELIQPLCSVVDRNGDEVIFHWDTGSASVAYSSPQAFTSFLKGEVTAAEYASTLGHRNDIRIAYERGLPLPEGASIVPPTEQEVFDMAEMLSADAFYRAIKSARQSQPPKYHF